MDTSYDIVQDYWHLYSDGKRADIPFLSDEDKAFAWNSLAICAFRHGVRILVATVNDTHLHTLVFGKEADVVRFQYALRHRIVSHYKKNGQGDKLGNGFYLACDPVYQRRELLQKFMYVYRNCLDFFPFLPGTYPWGAGNIYFAFRQEPKGQPLASLSVREQIKYLKTNTHLPQDWRIDENNVLVPSSFIDYGRVERLFGSVKAFLAFQFVKKEDEAAIKQDINRHYQAYRTMEDLRGKGNRISLRLCGKTLVKASFDIRLRTARQLIREKSAPVSESLAKAVYLKLEDLQRLL